MTNKSHNDSYHNALRTGQYAVVGSTMVESTVHPMPLKGYLRGIEEALAVLEQTTRRPRNAMFVVEAPVPLTLTAIVPATAQGSLFEADEAFEAASRRGTEMDESRERPTSPSPGTRDASCLEGHIERSALAEAERLALEARRISVAAIDVGTKLAMRAEKEMLGAEDLPGALSSSPSPKISRAIYALARDSERIVSFVGDSRAIGGRRQIPGDLLSARIFPLRGCQVTASPDGGRLRLRGRSDDPGWGELARSYPDACLLQTKDAGVNLEPLRLAEAMHLPIDLDVCVGERVRTGKRSVVPLRVRNLATFLGALRDRLDLLEEQNIDFESGVEAAID